MFWSNYLYIFLFLMKTYALLLLSLFFFLNFLYNILLEKSNSLCSGRFIYTYDNINLILMIFFCYNSNDTTRN